MYPTPNSNTGTALAGQSPELVKKIWQRGVDVAEQTEDVYTALEGSGAAGKPIHVETSTSAGQGQSMVFPVMSGFHKQPKLGEAFFTNASDFEAIKTGSYSLTVDYLHWATQYTERMEEVMGMRGEIVSQINVEIGKFLGREKQTRAQMCTLHKVNGENYLIAGNRSSINALTSADTLKVSELNRMNAYAKPMGGKPAMLGTDTHSNQIWGNVIIATAEATKTITDDPDYVARQYNAAARGDSNVLFRGGIAPINGHHVVEFNAVDHDGDGPVGSPFNPKAYLGVAIASGTTAVAITGGGTGNSGGTSTNWLLRDFPKYAFEFISGDSLSTTAATFDLESNGNFFVTIVNPRDGTANAGKFGIYECAANDGINITMVKRLGAAISGIAHTTVGGVTYDANLHTDAHPSGALVYRSTNKGLPLFYTPMYLRHALCRGYGKYRNHREQDHAQGKFVTQVFVRSIFGQSPRKNRLGRVPGVVILKHTGRYEGWNIPTVA